MAELDEIRVAIRAELGQFTAEMQKAQKQVKDTTGSMDSDFKGLQGTIAGLFGGYTIARFMMESVKAFSEAEQSVIRLDSALLSMGRGTAGLSIELKALASQIQAGGIFSDEEIIRGEAMLATFDTISTESLPRTVKVMADLAAKTGSVESAAMLLGRASAGMTEMLGRHGIVLSEAVKKSGDFSAILTEIESKVGGLNEALGDSASGGLTQFKNIVNDIQEEVGGPLTFAISKFAKGSVDELQWWGGQVVELFGFVLNTLDLTSRLFNIVGHTIAASAAKTAAALRLDLEAMKEIKREYDEQIKSIVEPAKITDRYAEYMAENGPNSKPPSDSEGTFKVRNRKAEEEAKEAIKRYVDFSNASFDEALAHIDAYNNSVFKQSQALKDLSDPTRELQRELARYDELLDSSAISLEDWAEAVIKANDKAMAAIVESSNTVGTEVTDMMQQLINATNQWGKEFTDTLTEAVVGGKLSFKDLAQSIIKDLVRIIIQTEITERILKSLNVKGYGGSNTGIISTIVGLFAGRASGGQVNAGQPYMVGERGRPEIFTPSTAGVIAPSSMSESQRGMPQQVLNISLNVSTGVAQTVRTELNQQMPEITKQLKTAVADARLRGGRFAAAFS